MQYDKENIPPRIMTRIRSVERKQERIEDTMRHCVLTEIDKTVGKEIEKLKNENSMLREMFGDKIHAYLRKKDRKTSREFIRMSRENIREDAAYNRWKLFHIDLRKTNPNRYEWIFWGISTMCIIVPFFILPLLSGCIGYLIMGNEDGWNFAFLGIIIFMILVFIVVRCWNNKTDRFRDRYFNLNS